MKLPSKCPICGGELVQKKVEEVIRGGNNTAFLQVDSGVCLKCGEHLYEPEPIRIFEETRKNWRKTLKKECKLSVSHMLFLITELRFI